MGTKASALKETQPNARTRGVGPRNRKRTGPVPQSIQTVSCLQMRRRLVQKQSRGTKVGAKTHFGARSRESLGTTGFLGVLRFQQPRAVSRSRFLESSFRVA